MKKLLQLIALVCFASHPAFGEDMASMLTTLDKAKTFVMASSGNTVSAKFLIEILNSTSKTNDITWKTWCAEAPDGMLVVEEVPGIDQLVANNMTLCESMLAMSFKMSELVSGKRIMRMVYGDTKSVIPAYCCDTAEKFCKSPLGTSCEQ